MVAGEGGEVISRMCGGDEVSRSKLGTLVLFDKI